MCSRNRECGMHSPVCFTRAKLVIGYVNLLLLFCGSVGNASLSKENGARACRQRHRDPHFQLDDLSTEGLDQLQNSPQIASVYRTDGEPVLLKRLQQRMPKRIRKSGEEYQFVNSNPDDIMGYDGNDGDVLKSLILHLIRYPRRFNRAEAKSENYNLRANYIPRLGRKRSYPGEK